MAAFLPRTGGAEMPAGAIVRPRLLDLLDIDPAPVTVLQAPSGYGKTTLVRQWASRPRPGDEHLVWVSLSAELASERALWTTVATAARRLGHLSPERAAEVADDVDALDDPVPAVRDLLIGRAPVVLVLDAYEHVRSATPAVDRDILRLTAELPDLRVVVTTRAATTLVDAVHLVRDSVRLIGERDLGFTVAETAALLAEELSGDLAEAAQHAHPHLHEHLHEDTHGYPLAIRAACLALRGRTRLPARGSAAWRAIVARDLSSQLHDPALSAFVRDTAAAPYFDLDLAQALTGIENADAVVAELEWSGFGRWVPYLADRPVFQYVDSLRDAVRADLRVTDAARYRRGAGIAAVWLHDQDEHEHALELAVDAGRYELAGRILRSVLLNAPEDCTSDHVDRQLSRIPRSALVAHPALAFARGLALLADPGARSAAVEYLLRAADQTSADWRSLDRPSSFFQRVARTVALRHLGRFPEAGAAAQAALDYYDDIDIGDDRRLVELRATGLRQLGYSLFQAGELDRAHEVVARAITCATRPWSRNHTVVYGVGLSAVDGRTRDAAHTARLVDPQAWPRDHSSAVDSALGRIGQAMARLDEFDFAGALAAYDGCESFVHTTEFWPFLTWTVLQARLGLGEAGPEAQRIAAALQAAPVPPGVGESFGTAALHGLLAVVWLSQGRGAAATELLRRPSRWPGQLAPAQVLARLTAGDAAGALHVVPRLESLSGHSVRSRTSLATLGAAAALRSGHPDAAGALLDRATSLYDEHGPRTHLLHVPGRDLDALRVLARDTGRAGAAAYLDVDVLATIDPGPDVAPLTPQELTVLRASADHPLRRDVAAALHLSPETVKSHMRSIYRKWGVDSRQAAIERGIRLGLLGDHAGD